MENQASRFKETNYIIIPGFAITRLNLSGNELLCYSLIYGFTQDEESDFHGSLSYVSSALNVTKANAKNIIDRLIAKGLVEKRETYFNRVKFCSYIAINTPVIEIIPPLSKKERGIIETITPPGIETVPPPGIETITNNTIIDNNSFDKIEDNNRGDKVSLTPTNKFLEVEKEKDYAERETVFTPAQVVANPRSRSRKEVPPHHFEQDPFYNFDLFVQQFAGQEFAGIDLRYYYNSAADWSASKTANKKSDWIATVRNWIRRDMSEGKVRRIQPSGGGLDEGAINYLNMLANL